MNRISSVAHYMIDSNSFMSSTFPHLQWAEYWQCHKEGNGSVFILSLLYICICALPCGEHTWLAHCSEEHMEQPLQLTYIPEV